ncbi:MAG: alpha/beta fold hydrolase [Bacteroidota bacterium]
MQLNHKVYGQGPALIILHGLFGSLDNWVSHARQLSVDYTVFLVDQRNHGRSPHDPAFSYPVMAEDLHEFMAQQGIRQAHLLGHSMGGKTVMTFADRYPDQVDKLIVADMAPKQYPPHHNDVVAAMKSIDLATLSSRQEANELMLPLIPELGVRQFLLKSLGRDEVKNFRWKFNLPVLIETYPNIIADTPIGFPFEGPTLFVHGGNSHYLAESDKPAIEEVFPHATFAKIPGAGHWLHAEKPAEFLKIVQGFLEG